MGKYHRFKIVAEGRWQTPHGKVRHPPVAANGMKIGDSLPAVESTFVTYRDLVSADGMRKVGGTKCEECSAKCRRCTCGPIVTSQ